MVIYGQYYPPLGRHVDVINAKDFEYEEGRWERPTKNGEPAKLIYGENIQTTATVDTYNLGHRGYAVIIFELKKPLHGNCFGWHDSQLEFKAVLGNITDTRPLGKHYDRMLRGVSRRIAYLFSLSGNTDPIHNKLQLTLSDKMTTPKVGLEFYGATVSKY